MNWIVIILSADYSRTYTESQGEHLNPRLGSGLDSQLLNFFRNSGLFETSFRVSGIRILRDACDSKSKMDLRHCGKLWACLNGVECPSLLAHSNMRGFLWEGNHSTYAEKK